MLFIRRKKSVSSVCPGTGRHKKHNTKIYWWIWLFPITGLLSLIWFLIRVIPKPSRATYPCQRLAAPIATGFIVWLTGLIGSTLAYRKARRLIHQSRYVLAGICAAVAVMAVWWPLAITADKPAKAWTPTEPPNTPMGTTKGIYPGRVVWLHEPNATSWNASTGSWWDDNNTDQAIVHRMVSKTIQSLTGQSSDPNAWDALFRHFNQTHGFGNVGYTPYEKIAVKINMNQDSGGSWSPGDGMPSPHVIYSLLDQLVHEAGVPDFAITIYDASRYIGDPIYNKIKSNLYFQNVRFIVNPTYAKNGRLTATRDSGAIVHTSYPGCPNANMPLCVTQAKYLINMALLRPHSMYGITLCAKNHYGSVHTGSWSPSPLHYYGDRDRAMGSYNCLVDLIGSQYLGGKTILYMIDGLYGAQHQSADVIRYLSFGDDWCSSIFASQDPVAIDSVALDFMRNEPRCTQVTGNPENYLHEAALANDPCSGTFYDPDHSGNITRLPSLGVHEHWNNATNKQYSRNLGTGNGIELLPASLTPPDERVVNQTNGNRYELIRHAIIDAMPGDQIVVSPGTYLESFNFLGKNITLRSIDPNDPAVVEATVIKGRSYASVVIFSVDEGPTSVLAGFTITGGNSGILIHNSSPTITNCVITENVSNGLGGGICCLDHSYPTIRNCTISNNSAVEGGGIYYLQPLPPPPPPFSASTSAAEAFTATNCAITGNTAQRGGGMYNSGTSPILTNCTFSYNFASVTGGGLHNYSSNPILANCILWDDTPDEIYVDGTGTTLINYSNIQGDWPGTGNIDANPHFTDPNVENYHLSLNSPCIDAGDPNYIPAPGETDIDGDPRISGSRIDIGADEFVSTTPLIEYSPVQFVFYPEEDGSNPQPQVLSIRNGGIVTLNWEITEDCDWLTVDPVTGSSSGEPNDVTLSVDMSGLSDGVYECELLISDPCALNSPQVVDVNLVVECFPRNHPDYHQWSLVGKPECWCYPRQCHGDADGLPYGKKNYWVSIPDLTILKAAWNITASGIIGKIEPTTGIPLACADFDHMIYSCCYRVSIPDLIILKENWSIPNGPEPDCLPGNRNP